MAVEIAPVTTETKFILHNLFPFYFHDLSQYDDGLDSNEYGLPVWTATGGETPKTPAECVAYNWWIREECHKFLIRADNKPVGFAIVNPGPKMLTEGIDYDLLDFFLVAKYRGKGIGRQAAVQVFEHYRGVWEVFQLARNTAAIAFWHRVISEYTNGDFLITNEGTRQQFDNRCG